MLNIAQSSRLARLVAAIALLIGLAGAASVHAWADDIEDLLSQGAIEELSQLQAQIESTAADYDDAMARIEELAESIDANQARIDEINEKLPGQEASAAGALKALYLLQAEGYDVVSMALSSENLSDFLQQVQYIETIHQHSATEIAKLDSLKAELEQVQADLEADKVEADKAAERASRAMEQAKVARQEAAERAVAEAQAQLMAQTSAAGAPAAAQGGGVDSGNSEASLTDSGPAAGTVSLGDVNWDMDRDAFIAEWTGRINNYLNGTAMAGTGAAYAEAAWNYGVDPRWSPAISMAESGAGQACFRSYNAWGWGNSSWSSWDEAIDSHVSGLARGYGSSLDYADAQKYCPPNADAWYNTVLGQMESM